MNLKLLLVILGVLLLLSGCSKSTLNVTHYSESKTTVVDMGGEKKYQIDNSEEITSKLKAQSYKRAGSKSSIYKSTGICSRIMFQHLPPLGRNQFYVNPTKTDIYKMFNGLDCETEALGFLEFHTCGTNYIVSYDAFSSDEGFLTEKMYLSIKDKECFDEIKKAAKK